MITIITIFKMQNMLKLIIFKLVTEKKKKEKSTKINKFLYEK